MHTRTQLKQEHFRIRLDGQEAVLNDLFPAWHRFDRFGIVIHDSLGGVGASHLLQLAIRAYYDADARRLGELDVYPEIYAFHVGGGHGSHADFDFWGPRREVILGEDPNEVLRAINERGITRLAVPDAALHGSNPTDRDGEYFEPKELAATQDLVASTFAYSPSGRTPAADVEIAGTHRLTEQNPRKVLDAFHTVTIPVGSTTPRHPLKEVDPRFIAYQQRRAGELTEPEVERASAMRARIIKNGVATETYRRTDLAESLRSLLPATTTLQQTCGPAVNAGGPTSGLHPDLVP